VMNSRQPFPLHHSVVDVLGNDAQDPETAIITLHIISYLNERGEGSHAYQIRVYPKDC
jgi:hypothetical protein